MIPTAKSAVYTIKLVGSAQKSSPSQGASITFGYWNILKTIVTLFVTLGIFCSAEAAQICWVERVAKHNGELRVYMTDGNLRAVRTITHLDGTQTSIGLNSGTFFILKEGESAYLSTLPHDSCTAKAITVDSVLGVKLAANACMDGICHTATQFVPAE